MIRFILGVIAGYAVWTAIWLGGNALFFKAAAEQNERGEPLTDETTLAKALVLSVGCSLAAGIAAAAIAKERKYGAVLVMGLLLLGTGIAVQAGAWKLMPLWYHLTFLGLLVPVGFLGSLFVKRKG